MNLRTRKTFKKGGFFLKFIFRRQIAYDAEKYVVILTFHHDESTAKKTVSVPSQEV